MDTKIKELLYDKYQLEKTICCFANAFLIIAFLFLIGKTSLICVAAWGLAILILPITTAFSVNKYEEIYLPVFFRGNTKDEDSEQSLIFYVFQNWAIVTLGYLVVCAVSFGILHLTKSFIC